MSSFVDNCNFRKGEKVVMMNYALTAHVQKKHFFLIIEFRLKIFFLGLRSSFLLYFSPQKFVIVILRYDFS